jgi:hypothetical protein
MYMGKRQNQYAAIVDAITNFHYIILADANVAILSIMLLVYQFSPLNIENCNKTFHSWHGDLVNQGFLLPMDAVCLWLYILGYRFRHCQNVTFR